MENKCLTNCFCNKIFVTIIGILAILGALILAVLYIPTTSKATIVQTEDGKVRGTETKSIIAGESYYSFLGIPYAEPPIERRRFLPPVPVKKWDGIYDATYERNICSQVDMLNTSNVSGSEDCLHINVFTPRAPSKIEVPKPVIVYFHGGAFIMGSGTNKWQSPDFLMQRDVLVVTLNYRLHLLGFLNLGIPECPGNAGLKDQVLALKWVQRNIRNFGGDPEQVTIMGGSAGGASVHFHLLSPMSKGLFHKASMLCGNVFSPWSVTYNPVAAAYKAAKKLGFQGDTNRTKLLEFFLEQTAGEISKAVAGFSNEECPHTLVLTDFKPSVEDIKDNAFLPDLPINLMKTANPVPVISGVNEREGVPFYKLVSKSLKPAGIEDIPNMIKHNFRIDSAKLPEVVSQVKQLYLGQSVQEEEIRERLIDLTTDIICYYFYEAHSSLVKSSSPTYFYLFAYNGDWDNDRKRERRQPSSNQNIRIGGSQHANELSYIFYAPIYGVEDKPTEKDQKMIDKLTTLLTDFVKTGDPNHSTKRITWSPSTENVARYLRVDSAEPRMLTGMLLEDRIQKLKRILGSTSKPYNFADTCN